MLQALSPRFWLNDTAPSGAVLSFHTLQMFGARR